MLKLKSIFYDPTDLVELIKLNSAAIINCDSKELFVIIKTIKGRPVAEVVRKDKKDIIVD